jgi:Zn-dependent protease
MEPHQFLEGILWFVTFLFSTTVHEAAHAWVALLGGDRTAYQGGQVSLSPLPHIRREPIGMVVVPFLTAMTRGWAMGWASAPYDPLWADRHPRRAAWMASAGPAANFCIAAAAFLCIRAGLAWGYFVPPQRIDFSHLAAPGVPGDLAGFLAQGLSMFMTLNVLLGTFNLIPLPPMDGSAVLGLVLPEDKARAVRRLAGSPQISLVGLLVAVLLFPRAVGPLFHLLIRLVHPDVAYS